MRPSEQKLLDRHVVLPRCAAHMINQGSGSIVNIATHAVSGRFRVPYAAAKAGQIGLTSSLAREVAHLGIRVNCVAPSGTGADDRVTPRNYGQTADVPELSPKRG